jgi:hypothetical protein
MAATQIGYYTDISAPKLVNEIPSSNVKKILKMTNGHY